jgi:hypothetical protein
LARFTAVQSARAAPENALTGTIFTVNAWRNDPLIVPAGLLRLSETTIDSVPYIQDHGAVYDMGTATHHLALYRHPSGTLVFGAGTVQWGWGLDAHHGTETGVPPERAYSSSIRVGVDPQGHDRNTRQATVNLFAEMGVQPETLQADLTPASASTEREAPTSTVHTPADGVSFSPGPMTINGSASDAGGDSGNLERPGPGVRIAIIQEE